MAETSWYVVWDDHEVANNYRAAHPMAPIGRRAFFEYWPVRQDAADLDRLYRSVRWGSAAELFLLDARQYRDEDAGTILGANQMAWLLDGLSRSAANLKFICTSVPFSSPASDKWGGYPKDRDLLLQTIRDRKLSGVIFLAADVHYAAIVRIPRGGELREVIAGPMAAQHSKAHGTAKRFEYFNKDHFNYGLVRVHADGERSYADIEILTDRNHLLYKLRIPAARTDWLR